MHNKNVITVENSCHNIPEMLHNHEHRLIQLESDVIENTGYVSNYMEYYTDNYTPVIQHMINVGVKHIIFNLPIKYHFKTTGTDAQGRNYCVAIDNQEGIVFEGRNGHTITYDYAENHVPNLFSCHSCQNLEFRNLNFEGVNTRVTSQPSTPLYTGSAIYCYQCKNVNIHDINSKNVIYQVLTFYSHDIDVRRTYNCHDYYNQPFQASTVPYAFIQCHSCCGYNIEGCTHYGGCRDGDITIFGGGGEKANITNNRLMCYGYDDNTHYSYHVSQAICNDQGCENAIIEGNFIDGYYYGIDMKADVRNCICTGNVIKNCKVYIADRRGESQTVYQTQFNHIINNMLIFQDKYVGNDTLFEGQYYIVGIMCDNRQGCHVENNTITLNLTQDLLHPHPCVGIYFSQEDINHDYVYPSTITNNHIIFTVANIGTVINAHGGSTMVHIKNVNYLTLSQNTFKGSYSQEFMGIKYQGNCSNLYIMDNQFWMGGSRLYREEDSNLNTCIHNVYGNLSNHKIGTYIESGNGLEMKELVTKDVYLSPNEPQPLVHFGLTAGCFILINVKGCADWNGEKYVNATFTLKYDTSLMGTLNKVDGVCEGYTFSVTSAEWGISLMVQSNTESPVNRFKIEIIQGQHSAKDVTTVY